MSLSTADPPLPSPAPALAGYQLRLPTFEGPLDVLLRLVERNQLPIAEVSLVAVTDQFLEHVAGLGDVPAETIADFAAVGARLVLLKSRSLLPRPPTAEEVEPDPGDLVRQLSEYQRIREATVALAERDRHGAGAFARGRGIAVPAPLAPAPLAAHQPTSLVRALRRRLTALAPPVQPLVRRPVVTLREMVERVLARLSAARTIRFRDVLAGESDRDEALTAFLAVLVLVRRRVVDADQAEPFGEITLRRAPVEREPASAGLPEQDEFAADD